MGLLSQNPNRVFLMAAGSGLNWAGHANDPLLA
jgi:alkaline phosphatase